MNIHAKRWHNMLLLLAIMIMIITMMIILRKRRMIMIASLAVQKILCFMDKIILAVTIIAVAKYKKKGFLRKINIKTPYIHGTRVVEKKTTS